MAAVLLALGDGFPAIALGVGESLGGQPVLSGIRFGHATLAERSRCVSRDRTRRSRLTTPRPDGQLVSDESAAEAERSRAGEHEAERNQREDPQLGTGERERRLRRARARRHCSDRRRVRHAAGGSGST